MRRKVLIVDDSETMRAMVSSTLGATGFEVIEASDGVQGLARLEEHPDVQLVVCDVNMPRMSGLEMLQAMKREPRHADLTVLMLTAQSAPELVARAKTAGAKAWLVKPFKADRLVQVVNALSVAV